MMKIFVISLMKDSDRRDVLAKSFVNYFDRFVIFNALDHQHAQDYLSHSPKLAKNKREMALSEIACALSHQAVLKKTTETAMDFSLILEDDIIGIDEDIDKISMLCLSLPKNSILIVGGQEGLRSYKNLYGVSVGETKDLYKIPKLYYRYLSRTCCYVVSNHVAQEVIKFQSEGLERADQWNKLLYECENVYFSPILKHPLTLENSHIEKERKIKKGNNIFMAIIREGITYSLYYYLRKIVTSYWAIYKGYIKIKDNS